MTPEAAIQPQIHYLKTWVRWWDDIEKGNKSFDVRRNDRNFQVGDVLKLQKYDPANSSYLGPTVTRHVRYVLELSEVPFAGFQHGYVVLGF